MLNIFKKKLVNKYPWLGKYIKYKFKLTWEDNKKDHTLGGDYAYSKIVLREDGDWKEDVPKIAEEIQRGNRLETMGCTGYGTLNAIELMATVKNYGVWNKSDRFTNKVSGTTTSGNNISKVFETIRKTYGLVDETDWPWDRNTFTWKDYYSEIPNWVYQLGYEWLKQYAFNYEIVGSDHASIKEGLKYSPVGVGVYAWYRSGDKYYSVGSANHWCIIVGQDWGNCYYILDSYPPYIKKLDWNFRFSFPRIFFLNKKEIEYNLDEIKKLISEGYEYIIRSEKNGEFMKLTDDGLVYVPKITDIADEIANRLKLSPANVNEMLKFLTQEKRLKWLDEKGYFNLIK